MMLPLSTGQTSGERPFENLASMHFQHRDNATGQWLPRRKLDIWQSVAQERLSLGLIRLGYRE
jgi:hypothetical protein